MTPATAPAPRTTHNILDAAPVREVLEALAARYGDAAVDIAVGLLRSAATGALPGLRRVMVERNLTQTEVAKMLGVTQSQVSSWMVGRHGLRMKTAQRIAATFALTVEQLVGPEPAPLIEEVLLRGLRQRSASACARRTRPPQSTVANRSTTVNA